MSTAVTLVTVEEFLRLSEPKSGHYELHHGEVVLVTAPKWGHTRIQERMRAIFERMFAGRGIVVMEMPFQPSPEYEVWIADLAVVRKERVVATGDDEYLQGAPDLVVEVLSPSNTVEEINDKMEICLDYGCSSFWVIDRKRKTVDVTENDMTKRYKQSATIESDILGGSVRVEEIFRA
jgi:Uma2 family endonuclease